MPRPVRTMVVDDSALVRARLVVILSRSPQIVVVAVAKTASEALERAKRTKPDVIILDIGLPGANGISIIQELKQIQPAPVVLMLTNYSSIQIQSKCKEAGADYFFDKSSEYEKVILTIESLRRYRVLSKNRI